MNSFRLIIVFTILSTFFGCSKGKDAVDVDLGYDYYPVSVGNEWVYEVELIDYKLTGKETSIYQLKEVVAEQVDGGDEENFLLYRYKRIDDTKEWEQDSVWSVKKEESYLVKTENNIRYQKLEFPITSNLAWDGNRWNTFDENSYEIIKLGVSYTLNNISYGEVLEVEQKVESNLILSIDNREYYAKNVGLIEVYKENLETQPGENSLGSIYHQVLISSLIKE